MLWALTGGAEPHSPGCSPSVTNKTGGLEDETELNQAEAKTRHGRIRRERKPLTKAIKR